jgi:LmbE family N-acetylglucosaminyl deacetylase
MVFWPNRTLAVDSNLLIIAVRPSEESSRYGGLIAELCRRGRPPFVTILTDGSSDAGPAAEAVAAAKAAAARRAVTHLGLPPERLLLIGLHDGAGSEGPAMRDALVSAFDLLS